MMSLCRHEIITTRKTMQLTRTRCCLRCRVSLATATVIITLLSVSILSVRAVVHTNRNYMTSVVPDHVRRFSPLFIHRGGASSRDDDSDDDEEEEDSEDGKEEDDEDEEENDADRASSPPPLSVGGASLASSLSHWWKQRWNAAQSLATLEQSVEDYNAHWVAASQNAAAALSHRRLIVMPLTENFNPISPAVFSHNHIQTGDKCSLPPNFWQAIQKSGAEVPWLFRIQRLDSERFPYPPDDDESIDVSYYRPLQSSLMEILAGPLDFRAPSLYIFLPDWMMRALGLRPRDVVQVDLVHTTPAGSLAKLRPHAQRFATNIANPQAVLETELRHYSSLTAGTTIAMDYNGEKYWFDVVETRAAPRGEAVPAIKVQDCDIATEFLTSKQALREKKRAARQRKGE
jgi:Ubiquitin fusion degradation protein UFD1